MSDYPEKNVMAKTAHRYLFANRFSLFLFRINKKRFATIFLSFFFCLSFHLQASAQQDSTTDEDDSENDSAVYDSAVNTATERENSLDTTGYYFNEKENYTDAYTDVKINPRASSDTTIQRLRKEDDFWYVKSIEDFKKNITRLRTDKAYRDSLQKAGLLAPDEPDFTEEPPGSQWYAQPWFNTLIWVIIVCLFLGAVVYFLLSNKINLFSRGSAQRSAEEEVGEENLFTTNYDSLLAKYIIDKNYRLAVRVLYLQLLKMLSERAIITFQPQFTNTQYLRQLASTSLYQDFFTVTRHYEYVWYGEFSLSDTAFQQISSDFANMKKEVLRK